MIPEYAWALGGVLCLVTLFIMIALGQAVTKNEWLDEVEAIETPDEGRSE
ncbi:hypothetical protein [Arthrobacter echini]|nr:hypothetical protein [Arthrobacter echini]